MKLPAIPFLTKSVNTEYFLALIFESDKISSILFKEAEKTLIILSSHETTTDLTNATAEDFIVSCDNVISRLEMSLPEGATLEKTIFAVPYAWVDDGKIKTDRLNQLKKISTELALTPMGFIVSIEAITAFLQKKEGAPVSGIFVELAEKFVSVFVVRGSNIIDVKQGYIEDGVEKTVEKLLGQVTNLDVLPSKIVLLHNKEAEAVSQKFLSHHWTKELPFMHLPQVSILERGFENEAIINGVASQLNVTLSGEVGESVVVGGKEAGISEVNKGDNFGFLKDEDIALLATPPAVSSSLPTTSVKEEELRESTHEAIVRHNGIKQEEANDEEIYEEDQPVEEDNLTDRKSRGLPIFASLSTFFTPKSLGRITKSFGNGKQFIIPLIALFVVVGLIVAYYAFFVKAKVILFTDQKAFAQDSIDITLSTDEESSFAEKRLKIATVEETVTGEQSQETTGKKDTGQKAIGTVTIFNKSEGSKQIEKGTTLTSSNNLEFVLNDTVNIASTSSFSTSFSNVQAKVTASNFGKEFNLPSQTNFTIKGISTSDVFGRNDAAFAGGSKEEIQVVSKKDLQTLENAVTERLFEKAKEQAEANLSAEDALVPMYLSFDYDEKKFDRKENDTAKSLKLTANIIYNLGIYNKEELIKFISSSDEFDVPDEFKLSDNDSKVTITDITQGKDELSAKLSFNAVFKPLLDIKKVPNLVVGKTTADAIKQLKSTPGISDASIQFENAIPFLPQIMPLNSGNVTVEIKAQ